MRWTRFWKLLLLPAMLVVLKGDMAPFGSCGCRGNRGPPYVPPAPDASGEVVPP